LKQNAFKNLFKIEVYKNYKIKKILNKLKRKKKHPANLS